MRNLTLNKEIIEKYAPYVRITTGSKPNVGAIRVSNNNFRWSASSSDFEYLFGLSIVMMAYSSDLVNEIKTKYGFKEPYFNFTFEGYSPIELVQLVESTVNSKSPKGGRPKPQFSDFKGTLIEYGTKPREVVKTDEVEQVETSKEVLKKEDKTSKGTVKEKRKNSKDLASDGVSEVSKVESEGSDTESERFPSSTEVVDSEHLEVDESNVDVTELLQNLETLHTELNALSKELEEHKSKIEVLVNENKVLKAKVDTALKGVFSALSYTLKEGFKRLFGRKQK